MAPGVRNKQQSQIATMVRAMAPKPLTGFGDESGDDLWQNLRIWA